MARPFDPWPARRCKRFLDRVVGFTVSPLLGRRLRAGLSAGRVQSAALAILAARDEKIRVFLPEEFFGVDLLLGVDGAEPVQAMPTAASSVSTTAARPTRWRRIWRRSP